VSRPALGTHAAPIQWVPRIPNLELKQSGRETRHSPPSYSEVKNKVKLYLHTLTVFTT
jgi:hypothetical protein